jgi:outer membrane lipoprotein SlyB
MSMRMTAIAGRFLAWTSLLAVASCAAAPPSPAPAATAAAKGVATVLAVRPIVAAGAGQAAAWRSVLLDGAAGGAGPEGAPAAGLAEFIVREDAGPTISIVQSNAAGLQPGDRVVVAHPAAAAGRASLIRLL